ncbi:MAG TPA: hydrogenase maturation nickel metallochaperone HypA [Candidatus Eremiobacteraeota bacterium]|nr:MAG: Hydrogenase/urease nickel incorporation protein HypA [bacterium ADurb.Bin363]HPZ08081.1 hydrogenase maturation nickel metallochaperone HypA [Candidatus Eremiobacteraeota bacterium]
MHELSLTHDMLAIAIKQGERYKAKKILSLKLKIGALTMLDPECFKFYFEQFSKDTIAEGALLVFEKVDIQIECKSCGITSNVKDFMMLCPLCYSPNVKLLSGQEILLEDIEVDL